MITGSLVRGAGDQPAGGDHMSYSNAPARGLNIVLGGVGLMATRRTTTGGSTTEV
ncbi:MAG TPA: hypothetical protein VI357_10765 [Mycobacteriales bacterium]